MKLNCIQLMYIHLGCAVCIVIWSRKPKKEKKKCVDIASNSFGCRSSRCYIQKNKTKQRKKKKKKKSINSFQKKGGVGVDMLEFR